MKSAECRVPRISKGSFSAAQVPARVLKRAPLTCPKSAEWGLVTPAKYRKMPWLYFDLRLVLVSVLILILILVLILVLILILILNDFDLI